MNYETILLQKQDKVATITLNRPEKLNTMSPELMSDLTKVMGEVERDDEIRAVIVTGAGRAFCAGGDVPKLFASSRDPITVMGLAHDGARMVSAMRNLPKPLIAAVNGPAIGGGLNIALACDIIIAAENASFCSAFISLGFHPDTGGIYFLTRLVGVARACELVFTGKTINAVEAERIGLVNHVVPADKLEATARELATRLANGPSKAIGLAKASIYQSLTMDMASVLELEARSVGMTLATEDANAAIDAFLKKGKVVFKGK
ncbi:MAG: enoyl-CoA hydratase/isomerase family protein [Dehalococcoidia bacterium]|nr:enoyl-CoA hydratase/isomerase family protein [Dehalococcoidia bacterium]